MRYMLMICDDESDDRGPLEDGAELAEDARPVAVIAGHKRSGSLQHRTIRLIQTRSLLQRILGDFRPACLPLSSSAASWRELLSAYWVNSSHNRAEGRQQL